MAKKKNGFENELIDLTAVRVVRRDDAAALVEWDEPARRAIVPVAILEEREGGLWYCPQPEQGAAYGVDWAAVVQMQATPEQLALELHRRGVWTKEDLRARPAEALAALQTVYGVDVAALLRAIEE